MGDSYDPSSAVYNATPEARAKTVLQATTFISDWTVQALAVQPSSGKKGGKATWMRQPLGLGEKSATVASGRAPGLFAPVGSDFVIGCDYMEVRRGVVSTIPGGVMCPGPQGWRSFCMPQRIWLPVTAPSAFQGPGAVSALIMVHSLPFPSLICIV